MNTSASSTRAMPSAGEPGGTPDSAPGEIRAGLLIPERTLSILLCLFFITVGFNRCVFPLLYSTAAAALFLMFSLWKAYGHPRLSFRVFLPLPAILYTALSPGEVFKDLPLADTMLCTYLAGLAAGMLPPRHMQRGMICLLFSLAFCYIYYLVTGRPEDMSFFGRTRLFFPHPNLMSAVILWCLFYLSIHYKALPRPYRFAVWLASPAVLAPVIMSGGRSAYLGFIAAMLFLAFSVWHRQAFKVLAALVLIAGCTYAVLPPVQQARLASLVQNPLGDPTFQSRLPIWEATWDGIKKSPVLGNSFRGFRQHHEHYIREHRKDLEQRYPCVEPSMGNPHNMYLGILFSYGILGTLLLILAFAPAVRLALAQHDPFLPCVLVFFAGYGLSDFPHNKDGIIALFFPLALIHGRELLTCWRTEKRQEEKRERAYE